jgi:AAA+ superfamily predicted ATPase
VSPAARRRPLHAPVEPSWTALPDALLARLAHARGVDPVGFGPTDADVDGARTRMAALLADEEPGPFASIVQWAGLDQLSAEVLAVCCAIELDPLRQHLVSRLHDDSSRFRPNLSMLRDLFEADHPGARAASPDGPLRRAHLVSVGDGPWAARVVAVPEVVLWRLEGDGSDDVDLPVDAEWVDGDPDLTGGDPLVLVTGDDRTRRVQAALAATWGTSFVLTAPPTSRPQWEALVRQATVDRVGVILEVDGDPPEEVRWWIERARHLAWCIASSRDIPVDRMPRRPWIAVQAEDRAAGLDEVEASVPQAFAHGHRLTADQLRQLRTLVPAVGGDVNQAVRRLGGGALDALARRVTPRRRLDDLVLQPDARRQLEELIARYRLRRVVHGDWGVPAFPAAGLSALFAGPSGTGKTVAAEVVAGALELDMYIVDLATVVSKYIGETEKNLNEVFDAAAAGEVVLLFDEADAIFGERGEVSDARDRYANLEVSYLLQRLERFDGLTVMTTNLEGNIDQAFLRRISARIEFAMPDRDERGRLWQQYLGTGMPLAAGKGAVDIDFLAGRFELSGASIRNVSLSAAFLAAQVGGPVAMETVMLGLKRELQKLGRLFTEDDFGPWAHLVDPDPAQRRR